MAEDSCTNCGKKSSFFKLVELTKIEGQDLCPTCAAAFAKTAIARIIATTTLGVDGHAVVRHLDVESVEVVMGTGVFSEFEGEFADFFGTRSTAFEIKLQKAKRAALDKLKYTAYERGGNAVIGVDLDYTEFSGNRVGVIANGTIVEIRPI